MDSRPHRRNIAAFSNFSGVAWEVRTFKLVVSLKFEEINFENYSSTAFIVHSYPLWKHVTKQK